MRQKSAIVVIAVVVAVLLAVLGAYGLLRSRRHHEPFADEGAAEHHEHIGPAAEREHAEELSPSGSIEDGVRVIKVAARQFEFDPDTIVVRQGERIRLEVTSEDVTHGIEIEGLNIDRTLEPGKTEAIPFTAGEPGRYHFHCSVYCGKGHGDMHGELIVLPQDQ